MPKGVPEAVKFSDPAGGTPYDNFNVVTEVFNLFTTVLIPVVANSLKKFPLVIMKPVFPGLWVRSPKHGGINVRRP